MSQVIRIQFATYEDDMTREKRLEAKAVDVKTGVPLASLPVTDMHQWLQKNGFRARPLCGVWETAA